MPCEHRTRPSGAWSDELNLHRHELGTCVRYDASVRSDDDVRKAFALWKAGNSKAEVARRVGISHATVRDWLSDGEAAVLNRPMRRRSRAEPQTCTSPCPARRAIGPHAYAYLLGQHLGDGCISTIGRSYRLRVSCCDAYPDIMRECEAAIVAVVPGARVGKVRHPGCTEVFATFFHWPCLLPHGKGKKHTRAIVLDDWQRSLALDVHPQQFLRGLIHSDGCRCINRVRVRDRTYEYPRYLFSNKSRDIQALFLEACDRLGIAARPNKPNSISVAQRDAVRKLDTFVGPKT